MVKKETKGVTKSGIKNKIKEFPVLGKVMKELAYYLRWFVPHDKRPEDRKMRVILTKMCKNEEMFKKMNTSLHLNTFTEIPYFSAFYLYLRMLKELKR